MCHLFRWCLPKVRGGESKQWIRLRRWHCRHIYPLPSPSDHSHFLLTQKCLWSTHSLPTHGLTPPRHYQCSEFKESLSPGQFIASGGLLAVHNDVHPVLFFDNCHICSLSLCRLLLSGTCLYKCSCEVLRCLFLKAMLILTFTCFF